MAGPQDIQRLPAGLIDLLGMRATGQTPATLAQSTQPTLDLFNLYAQDRRITQSGSPGVAPTVGGWLPIVTFSAVVPAGKLWLLFHASAIVPAAAAATSLTGFVALRRFSAGGTSVDLPLTDTQTAQDAARSVACRAEFPEPIVLRAGDNIGWYTLALVGAPASNPVIRIDYAEIGS